MNFSTSRELAGDRKIYGLQAVGLDGREPRHSSVEEMAAHYVREIRSLQPDGPYHLMGHSLGGWIAYAVAQELTRQGGNIGVLALLDTRENCILPWSFRARRRLERLVSRLRRQRDQLKNRPFSEWPAYFQDRWDERSLEADNRQSNQPGQRPEVNSAQTPKTEGPIDYYYTLMVRYRPTKYARDIDLFMADSVAYPIPAFWNRITRGTSISTTSRANIAR